VTFPGTPGQYSFQSTIVEIQGYTCQAVDNYNTPYTLYFGGGTNIESVNKPVPEVGDVIYWLGVPKTGGKTNDFNVNQCISL
jgi:hypothetical protein